MQIDSTFDIMQIALLACVLFAAVVYDWRERRIPNALILLGIGGGLLLSLLDAGTAALQTSLLGLLVGFVLLLPGFAMRFTGAGDVKLLATLGVILGPGGVIEVFLVSVVLGAAYVLLTALFRTGHGGLGRHLRRYRSMIGGFAKTGQWVYLSPDERSSLSQRLPMAPFFATAVGMALVSSRPWVGV